MTTFAASFGQPPKPFLVMAMPEIWRKTPRHANEKGLDRLIRSVFVHEMMHTQQSQTLGARIDALVAEHKDLDAEMSDDIRRGGRVWSQDEGLAAFLVLDAFLPGWQSRVFAENPPPLIQLLEEASPVESCHDPSEAP